MSGSERLRDLHSGELGATSYLDQGVDSSAVYRFQGMEGNLDIVMKEYQKLVKEVGQDKADKILREYTTDILQLVEYIKKDHNPRNQSVTLDDKDYPLYYEFVPAGEILLRDSKGVPTVVGQKFIPGKNLSELLGRSTSSISLAKKQKLLPRNIRGLKQLTDETGKLAEFSKYLTRELNIPVNLLEVNVKPFVEKNRLKLLVTDFAGSLEDYYNQKALINKAA